MTTVTARDDLSAISGENSEGANEPVAARLVGPGEKPAAFQEGTFYEGVLGKQFRDNSRSAAVDIFQGGSPQRLYPCSHYGNRRIIFVREEPDLSQGIMCVPGALARLDCAESRQGVLDIANESFKNSRQ